MAITDVEHSSMPAGRFKAVCLKVLDEVAETRVPVTITKRGKPVARLVPVEQPAPLFGALAGTVGRYDDLISPVDDEWDALR
ncbi:type II toxin-antitoxin system Phd/YefM family antitoxin [Phytoactinopolyspora endophytica]|uniref:type II toxin-antitoxin system Phd/YefM family antitoxin n=1 Tax=Phytoactinopolyspora endophytica TaxID=1642495 RepID=UPI00197C0DD7|nr:type II toxin-antitoxin system Phd/YefM family antitoxin [Phytoactinopolyspora endophytica]